MKTTLTLAAIATGLVLAVSQSQAELAHRYSFNDGTATDTVANANGVLFGGATVTGGQLTLDGINDFVALPNDIAKFNNITVEMWVTWNGGSAWQRIFDFGDSSVPIEDYHYMFVSPNGDGTLKFASFTISGSGGGEEKLEATPALSTGSEYMLAYTLDDVGDVSRLYLDGVQVAVNNSTTINPTQLSQVNMWLGRSQYGNDPFYNGTINEFRIWDEALSAATIAEHKTLGPEVVPEPSAGQLVVVSGLILWMLTKRHYSRP